MDNIRQINDLISATNDAANLARTLIAGFLVVALTMAAMVVGTSDEAILRNSLEVAPTLGVSVSVSVAHLYAPIILVFLHVSALIQLELVAERLRAFEGELACPNLTDSERRHQRMRLHGLARTYLLRDMEQHRGTRTIFHIVAWFTIACVPLVVLLALQVGFLRYQNSFITFVQQTAFVLDVAALRWFQLRLRTHRNSPGFGTTVARVATAGSLCLALIFSIVVARPPTGEENVRNIRWAESRTFASWLESDTSPRQSDDTYPDDTCTFENEEVHAGRTDKASHFEVFVTPILAGCNPLDVYVCPWNPGNWGCRFLRLSHRKLVGQDIPPGLIERLFVDDAPPNRNETCQPARGVTLADIEVLEAARDPNVTRPVADAKIRGQQTVTQMWARLVGLRLRGRNFRFADFEDSSLYGIDLINSELQGANLEGANMQWSWLDGADLSRAILDDAHLEYTSFVGAVLTDASLRESNLFSTDFTNARMERAGLNKSDLKNVKMTRANLRCARLRYAVLESAKLEGAILDHANLKCSNLEGANFDGASVIGADFALVNRSKASFSDVKLRRNPDISKTICSGTPH